MTFGLAAALVIAGGICAGLVGGVTGTILTITLISSGLGGALLLVFLEIGLGEERDLAEEQRRRDRGALRRARLPRRRRPD
jgi:hypothetical protein